MVSSEREGSAPLKKVLVLEDDEVLLAMLKTIFADELPDLDISYAESLRKAWEKIAAGFDPDIVVADYHLPDGKGVDIVPYIMNYREERGIQNEHPPFLMVCSATMRHDVWQHGLSEGIEINLYVKKPPNDIYEELVKPLQSWQRDHHNKM